MSGRDWPQYRTAADLVGSTFPASEEAIHAAARKHGIGRMLGRKRIFSAADVDRLYEALRSVEPLVRSKSYPQATAISRLLASLPRALANVRQARTDG